MGIFLAILAMVGCATKPPAKLDNICDIFRDKDDWYQEAAASRQKWGVPISVMMAFMHQESRFVAGGETASKANLGFYSRSSSQRRVRLFSGEKQHMGLV
jgi:hypothetical protein